MFKEITEAHCMASKITVTFNPSIIMKITEEDVELDDGEKCKLFVGRLPAYPCNCLEAYSDKEEFLEEQFHMAIISVILYTLDTDRVPLDLIDMGEECNHSIEMGRDLISKIDKIYWDIPKGLSVINIDDSEKIELGVREIETNI